MADNKTPVVERVLDPNGNEGVRQSIDDAFMIPALQSDANGPYRAGGSGIGNISTAIGDSFYGINHRQQPYAVPINRDVFGLTFFTRPLLNLTSQNVRTNRKLSPLLSADPTSLQRIFRCTLDPRLASSKESISSPLVDPQQAFIPILTNNLISMSGWPDQATPIYQSTEGVYKETFGMVDGIVDNFSSYEISASFRNMPGDPITGLAHFWQQYMSSVFVGNMVPYPDLLIENEIDYQTRIYRLVLDWSKQKVQKIAACGAAILSGVPNGAAFNFESDRPLNNANDQISLSFRCFGAMYQDDILVVEFNAVVCMFCDLMQDRYRPNNMVQVPIAFLEVFNSRGYPRINPANYNLEWWVTKEDYAQLAPKVTVPVGTSSTTGISV